MGDAGEANEYEQARLRRIAENRKRLNELVPVTSHALAETAGECPRAAEPQRKKAAQLPPADRRGSSRLANLPPVDYCAAVEDGGGSSRKRGAPRCDHGLTRGEHNKAEGTSCHFCRRVACRQGVHLLPRCGVSSQCACLCRQKTDAYKARCTTCPSLFCAPCLWLRHGAKATDVNETKTWICPKCRLSCTCSICRRKAGKQPTGVLGPKALALGYAGAEGLLKSDIVL